jgi:hypothetical protein
MKPQLFLVILGIFWPIAANGAAFVTGNELVKYCEQREHWSCAAYIAGVSDTLELTKEICVPNRGGYYS